VNIPILQIIFSYLCTYYCFKFRKEIVGIACKDKLFFIQTFQRRIFNLNMHVKPDCKFNFFTAILSIMRTQTFKQSAGTWFFASVNQHKNISKLKNKSQKKHQMETKYDFELNYGSFGPRMYLVLNLFEFWIWLTAAKTKFHAADCLNVWVRIKLTENRSKVINCVVYLLLHGTIALLVVWSDAVFGLRIKFFPVSPSKTRHTLKWKWFHSICAVKMAL